MNFKFRGKVNTKPLKEAKSDDEDFENYDMFVFITNLFTRDHKEIYKRPLNPLGRPHKHFDYVPKDEDRSAPSPITSTVDGDILITAPNEKDFDDVKAICDKYKFNYEVYPNGKYWSCEIEVPSYSPGYPMLVEDYFEDLGMSVDDVMPSWYSKQMAKAGVGVNESIGNLKRVVDKKSVDPVAALGVTMAAAYNDSEDADKEIEKRMDAHKKETGIDYSKPFTGTAKSGETKKVSTPSLKKMHLSESLFEDVKPDESTIKADLQTALRKKGLKLNPKECGIDDAVENIMMSNGELTVDEWIKETQRNYPKCFKESLSESVDHSSVAKQLAGKHATGTPKRAYNMDGYVEVDLDASDDAINSVISNIKSNGFKQVEYIDPDTNGDEGWVTFAKNGETPTVACVLFGPGYATLKVGYDENEDSDLFEESLTEGRYGQAPKYTIAEAENMRDQFIAMIEEGTIDAVEAIKSFCYWLTANEIADFIDANGFLPDDDLYEGCSKKKSLKEDSEQDEINAFTDEYWDKYESICRYLDVEIPDKCGEVRDYVNTAAGEQMSMNSLDYILGKCRRFHNDLEYVLK